MGVGEQADFSCINLGCCNEVERVSGDVSNRHVESNGSNGGQEVLEAPLRKATVMIRVICGTQAMGVEAEIREKGKCTLK